MKIIIYCYFYIIIYYKGYSMLPIPTLIISAGTNANEKGFWDEYDKSESESHKKAIIVQQMALIMTEVGEGIEALRKGNRSTLEAFISGETKDSLEEELADAVIRIADLCFKLDIDLEGFISHKMKKNKDRPRLHGKEF